MADMQTVTLKRTSVRANGTARYALEGVRTRIVFGPKLFPGGAPEEVTLSAPAIAQPAADAAEKASKRAERKANAEKTREERIAKAEDRAKKAEERAKKSADRLAKMKAKATKGDAPTASDSPVVEAAIEEQTASL